MKISEDVEDLLIRIVRRRRESSQPSPLLIELFGEPGGPSEVSYESYPFRYHVSEKQGYYLYEISCDISRGELSVLRQASSDAAGALDPDSVDPLTFDNLIRVLTQLAAASINAGNSRVRELTEVAAYEAIGLSRILALAKDQNVSEYFVDSESSPVYLDHSKFGRCETGIFLTDRERHALETHLDTFRGYTPDYLTPSLKNDLEISGARLRVSLDLEPLSVNRFALDVRRLDVSSLSMGELINMGVISLEAASILTGWLEVGGNCTIVGETGTGKTTLLNALDELIDRRFRRLYIEDAVETIDMLGRGYHQMKVKVDPYERGNTSRTKEAEIVKALHRSPDIVILSELQSKEHSSAFFQSLAAGARGIQTFHASSIEQAMRRWMTMHAVPEESLLDLGMLVLMSRPDKLKPARYVQRVCYVTSDSGRPRTREMFLRDRAFNLVRVMDWDKLVPPGGASSKDFGARVAKTLEKLKRGSESPA